MSLAGGGGGERIQSSEILIEEEEGFNLTQSACRREVTRMTDLWRKPKLVLVGEEEVEK